MALQTLLVLFFIIYICSFSCHSNIKQEDPHYHYIDPESGYDPQAYPSYFSTIEDGEQFDKVGSLSTSVTRVFSVNDFGATGDGSDATEAFMKAWQKACSSAGAVIVVPKNESYLLKPIRFAGPCKSNLKMEIYGIIKASDDPSDYKKDGRYWILFDTVQNLLVEGGGTINGNGKIWWQNSCKTNKALPCKDAPTALTFNQCKNLVVKNLKIQDAQQIHVSFQKCTNVLASNLMVTAPGKSPNTDGIHVTGTQNIQIASSVIGTGDDCISIVSGSQKVQATDITCGPGHGISIGSLGAGNSEAHVSDVVVDRAKLSGTTNGVRIKTWQGGFGSASNIKFQNVDMHNVENPIIIDQNYCDKNSPCKEQKSAVQIKNVVYENIKGTSASNEAIKFNCSKGFPCQGIILQNVKLEREGGHAAKALCTNVKYTDVGVVSPRCH